MEEKEKNDKTPKKPEGNAKEQTALKVRIQNQVEALSEEEKLLFNIYAGENQNVKMGVPEIRINYDEDNGERGSFIAIDYEDKDDAGNPKKRITFLAPEIEVTIMRTRFKFGFFDQDKGEKGMELYGTPEMDSYNEKVNLWDNEQKKIIFTGQYKAFKNYINETYPDPRLVAKGFAGSIIKHTEILYVEYEGKIHRMYLSKTARDNYWAYKEEIKGVPTFAFKTKLTTSKEKSGSITYFPIHFEKVGENEIKKYILLRKKLDESVKIFDEFRENLKGEVDSNTIKGEDPDQIIIKKYKLNFGENFKNPICPDCGANTILRDSFKGPFFGCSTFPDCKGIVKLEDVIEQAKEGEDPVIDLDKEEEKEETKNTASSEVIKDKDDIDIEKIPF